MSSNKIRNYGMDISRRDFKSGRCSKIMTDVDQMFYDNLMKIKNNQRYEQELNKMDTAKEKITLGLSILYDGYENIPKEAMDLATLSNV